jgi:hypothetical protein
MLKGTHTRLEVFDVLRWDLGNLKETYGTFVI